MATQPWMFVRELETLEHPGIDTVLDRLETGGLRALVLGDLWFQDGTPGFAPHRELYVGLSRTPPEVPAGAEPRAAVVAEAIRRALARGFEVYLHDWGQGGGGQGMNDPESTAYAAARTRDALAHFPGLSGFIADGPEWGYEIEPGNRQDLFRPFTDHDWARAREWGYNRAELEAGVAQFDASLRHLGSGRADLWLSGQYGFFDAADAFLADPQFLTWLRFREESVARWVGAVREAVQSVSPATRVACGPRTAAFAPLAGYSLRLLARVTDFLCPKLYFWARGFDGLKGTVHRWARTLGVWNPDLTEAQALAVTFRLFGFTIPGVSRLADLEKPLDRAFFQEVVPAEIARAVLRAGDPSRLQPWLGLHHGGVRISTQELEWLLEAVDASPLPGYIYWHYEDMQPEEWELVRVR